MSTFLISRERLDENYGRSWTDRSKVCFSVRSSSEAIRSDLQKFLDRQVNLFYLPPNTTGDTDICLTHIFPVHVCFESSLPLFDPTVRHFLVPHDLKDSAGMKSALLTTHALEHTLTEGLYCPAKASRLHLIGISNQSSGRYPTI